MGKDIGKFYEHSQSQISTLPIKASFISSLASQTLSSIELTITSVPSVRDKNQTNSVLRSKNFIQNGLSIINKNEIQSCETVRKENYSIPTTSTPNNHAQRIAATSLSLLNLHKTTILPPVRK